MAPTDSSRTSLTSSGASSVALLVLGGGKMGEALVGGLVSSGWVSMDRIVIVEPIGDRRVQLESAFPGMRIVEQIPHDLTADGALIAVKPQQVVDVCRLIAPNVKRVLSIAAGVRIATIESALSIDGATTHAVIRSMPNTPALVGMGASAIAGGSHVGESDMEWAASILGAVGVVERVDEKLLDAVTGLSGSGPAYVFLVAEALIEGGVAVGLPRSVAVTLAHQTIAGAGRLLLDSGEDAATLRGNVTSPGGTTAAGLRALEAHGLRSALIEAVAAATQRAHELG